MVSITVTVFAGVSLVVFNQVNEAPDSETARLSALARGTDTLIITHQGGEALLLADGELQMVVDGTEVTLPLTDLAAQTADGTSWVIGETLCIVGADAACLYPSGTDVSSARLVAGNRTLLNHGDDEGGAGGGGGGVPGADPGHPYVDANANGIYDAGDTELTDNDVLNGYDAGSDALVIPASTSGGIMQPATDAVWSGGAGVTFLAGIIANGDHALTFVSANGDVVFGSGKTIRTDSGGQDIQIDAGGDVMADGATFDAGPGFIRIGDTAYLAGQYIGGSVSLVGATLEGLEAITISAAGDIDVQDAVFRQGSNPSASVLLQMDDTADTIYLDGSQFRRYGSTTPIDVDLEPNYAVGHVNGTPAVYDEFK